MKRFVALLVMVSMLLCSVGLAEGTAALQEVKCGNVTFQLPAELEVTASGDEFIGYLNGTGEKYSASVTVMNWGGLEADISKLVSNAGIQINNVAAMLISSMVDTESVNWALNNLEEKDIGMLHGDPVVGIYTSATAMVFHHYRNTGISVLVNPQSEMTEEELLEISSDIMRSARWDGVSEEDMIADAQADYVVVTADSGRIRAEASLSGEMIKTAYKGETYKLIEHSSDWYIIEVDGRTGYLHTGVAEIQ